MKALIAGLICFTLIGCANTSEKNNTKNIAKNDIGYECQKIKVTGKLVPQEVCTTKIQRKKMEDEGKEGLKNRRVAVTDVVMDGY